MFGRSNVLRAVVTSLLTLFNTTENPVSEGGRFSKTDTTRTAMRTLAGVCQGTQTGTNGFDDSQAAISGFNTDCQMTATIFKSASIGALNHEVALCFRNVETSNTTKKYEILVNKDGGVQFMKWLGGVQFSDFQEITTSSGGSISGISNGDKIRARCRTVGGNTELTLWYTPVGTGVEVQQAQATDSSSPYLTGDPGIGAYISDASSNPAHYALTDLFVENV